MYIALYKLWMVVMVGIVGAKHISPTKWIFRTIIQMLFYTNM